MVSLLAAWMVVTTDGPKVVLLVSLLAASKVLGWVVMKVGWTIEMLGASKAEKSAVWMERSKVAVKVERMG